MMGPDTKDYSQTIEAMRAAGLTDAEGPLYDLQMAGNPVPRTIKLDFTAINPSQVFDAMCAQIYVAGWHAGEDAKSWEIRQAIGLG